MTGNEMIAGPPAGPAINVVFDASGHCTTDHTKVAVPVTA